MIAVENTPKRMIAVVFARSALVASASIQEIKVNGALPTVFAGFERASSKHRHPRPAVAPRQRQRQRPHRRRYSGQLGRRLCSAGQLPPYSPVSAACEFVSVPSREAAKQFQWVGDARAFFEGVVPTSAWSDAMVT